MILPVLGNPSMEASDLAGHVPPSGSVMTVFRFSEPDAPKAVVIGPGHAPYYVYPDGRIEPASPDLGDDWGGLDLG